MFRRIRSSFAQLLVSILLVGTITSVPAAAAPALTASDDAVTTSSRHFALEGLPADNPLAASLLRLLEEQYERVDLLTPRPMPPRVRLIWMPTAKEFAQYIADHDPAIQAVALRGKAIMILNGTALRQSALRDARQTLVHELVHIYVSTRIPAELPLWLNEGLALHLAQQTEWEPDGLFTLRAKLGRLPRLDELSARFSANPARRQEAYRCSYLAVKELRERIGLYDLLGWLEDPAQAQAFFTPEVWEELERSYRAKYIAHGGWLRILTSDSLLWLFLTLLFLAAWWIKRVRSRRKLEQLEREQIWEEGEW